VRRKSGILQNPMSSHRNHHWVPGCDMGICRWVRGHPQSHRRSEEEAHRRAIIVRCSSSGPRYDPKHDGDHPYGHYPHGFGSGLKIGVLFAGKSERTHVPEVLLAPGEPPEVTADACDVENRDGTIQIDPAAGLADLCVGGDQDPNALSL
jgi:hypothetical protein